MDAILASKELGNLIKKSIGTNITHIRTLDRKILQRRNSHTTTQTTNINIMVAAADHTPVAHEDSTGVDSATEEKPELTPKQLQRLEEQKAREAKKAAKRKAKALAQERKAEERARKEAERERRLEEIRLEKEAKTPKELEEEKRQQEERELLQKEFAAEQARIVNHTKLSALESNRLGGAHMA